MSDLSIPGVSGNYDKYVESLMKVERVPRDHAAEDLEKFQLQQGSWRGINKLSADLKSASDSLYSFNNPFAEKIVESTNDRAITAVAKRDSKEQSFKVRVNNIASTDSFLSSEIEKDGKVPRGKYTFLIGEKTISFNWKGGRYRDFIDLVNRRGKGVLSVSEVKTTSNTRSLLFKSEIPGEKNRLEFSDDALSFALENGIIKKNDSGSVNISKNNFISMPQSTEKIDFSNIVKATDGNIMEIELSILNVEDGTSSSIDGKDSIDYGNIAYEQRGSIFYKGISVTNDPSDAGINMSDNVALPTKPVSNVVDMNIISLESSRGVMIPAPPISDVEGKQVVRINLADYGNVKGLVINNPNTSKKIDIENIKIFDPKANGEYVPVNPISVAQDANFQFEGINIKREKNEIDDLVPGITLNLHESTDKEEKIDVKPDVELIKNSIIEFVGKYNRLVAEINILTQNKPEIIEELSYFTDDEKESAEKKLGLMFGDSTLNGLKNRLRMQATDSYKSSDDTKILLLSHIGISTKSDKGGSIQASRLRGYLEINEKELDSSLKNNMEDVKKFFGFDSNGDILVDNGLAFKFNEQLEPYVQRGGIFGNRSDAVGRKINTTEKKIEEYDKKLARKEAELRRKYASMEGTLKDLEAQSNRIKGFAQPKQGE